MILDNGALAGTHSVERGQVTFSIAPASGHALSWFGYFYFGCRFLQDDLSFEQIVQQLWERQEPQVHVAEGLMKTPIDFAAAGPAPPSRCSTAAPTSCCSIFGRSP